MVSYIWLNKDQLCQSVKFFCEYSTQCTRIPYIAVLVVRTVHVLYMKVYGSGTVLTRVLHSVLHECCYNSAVLCRLVRSNLALRKQLGGREQPAGVLGLIARPGGGQRAARASRCRARRRQRGNA